MALTLWDAMSDIAIQQEPDQNCNGMRWEVLNWNAAAIDFYRSLGAKIQDRWLPVLFMGREFEEFASQLRRDRQ
jgi:hypothetical protein